MRSAGRRTCGRGGGVRRLPRRSAAARPACRCGARVPRASAVIVIASGLGSLVAVLPPRFGDDGGVSSLGHISASQVASCFHSARPGLRVTSSGCSAGMPIAARAVRSLRLIRPRPPGAVMAWSPVRGSGEPAAEGGGDLGRQACRPQCRPCRDRSAGLPRRCPRLPGPGALGSSASQRRRACRAAIARCRVSWPCRGASCGCRLSCWRSRERSRGVDPPQIPVVMPPQVSAPARAYRGTGSDRAVPADPFGDRGEVALPLAGEPCVRVGLGAQRPFCPPSGDGQAGAAAPCRAPSWRVMTPSSPPSSRLGIGRQAGGRWFRRCAAVWR